MEMLLKSNILSGWSSDHPEFSLWGGVERVGDGINVLNELYGLNVCGVRATFYSFHSLNPFHPSCAKWVI